MTIAKPVRYDEAGIIVDANGQTLFGLGWMPERNREIGAEIVAALNREPESQDIARIRKWVAEMPAGLAASHPHFAGYIWRDDVLAFIDKLADKPLED